LIHEMATGARPFPGASTPDVVGAILHADVELPRPGEPGVPPMLSRIVQRCLRKDPSQRYQSAGELLEDLRSVAPVGDPDAFRGDAGTGVPGPGSPAPRLRRPGVVVLPFVNISADTDNEYFSDGLTDEVIAQLAAIGGLRVISRTSAMRLKGTSLSLAEIARKLGVRYVLEGSVRKAGGMFRVTAQLVDAHTDDPLWTLARSGEEGDVFSVQEDVARGVVEALSVHLTPSETEALAARPIEDWRAYEAYLRARYEAWRFTADGLERAQHYVESALEIVGENELLFTTLGLIAAMSIEAGVAGGPEALDRVEEYADRVFDIDPRSARGNWLRAFAAVNRGDVGRAIRAAERARHLSPEDPDILLLLGYVYARLDRTERADALIRQAAELDPLTPITQCMPGFVRLMEGRFDEAVEPYRRQVALDPHNPFAAVTLGWALAHAGRNEEAVAVLDDASSRFPETPFGSWAGSLACGLRGDADGAAGAVTPAFEAAAGGSEMFARALAECYALAGARDEALRWLERAVDLGLLSEAFIATHDGFLASLRDDPGFGVIVARVRSEAADVLEVLAEVAPEVGPEG
ncbi:MAG: tetratricopeptide repeat protein, partial [Gemmatimonadota bacterium]|nr:tetratricopeptide repeat protein [Gemmatimonadota bacterium]